MQNRKIVVAVTGASGAIYAKLLIEKLKQKLSKDDSLALVFSTNAKHVWSFELDEAFPKFSDVTIYEPTDFNAPFASGSAQFDTMIVCPCSMGILARIASGISNDLITRAADVVLKERRKLILVTRETPLSIIHINNMKMITQAGGIICPAVPSFYSKPQTINDLAATVVDRVLDLAALENETYRWQTD